MELLTCVYKIQTLAVKILSNKFVLRKKLPSKLFHKNVSLRDFYVLSLSIANPKCASNKLHNPSNHSVASVPSGFSGNLDNSPTTHDCAAIGSATNVEDQLCSQYYASICEINTFVDLSAINVRT